MTSLFESQSTILLVVSVALAVLALVVALLCFLHLRNLRRPFKGMAEVYAKRGGEGALEELLKGVDENREFLRGHSEELKRILGLLAECYCGMGLVKYNAFEDIGGMQSYSLCLLTRQKNGCILTNLVGRTSTRGYALEVKDAKPSRQLSDEEKEALEACLRTLSASER